MPSNLKRFDQTTSFIGREKELRDIKGILDHAGCRLLTIMGIGGIGKTRLAVQVAKDLQKTFPDGTWFVNLQPLMSGDNIATAVMDAMGVVPSGHDTIENQLIQYLQGKKILFLLDNFEHVMDGVSLLVRIIRRAPKIQLLVTSRQALSVPEEWLYLIEGLPAPQSHQTENIGSVSAVRLFVERARQVRPGFTLPDDTASVVRICQIVDGLPLAIEMAASWTKTMRPSEISAEIQQNLNFLSSNLRHVPDRHRSMQAVFSQTWDHLEDREQDLIKRLTVFKGGFLKEAAESVSGAPLSLLSSLQDKCLLHRDPSGRYQFHELLRQYTLEKMGKSEMEMLSEAHCRYYCDYLAQRKLGLTEGKQVAMSEEIEPELENIRSAWQFAVDNKYVESLRKAAAPYFYFCQLQSRYLESATASGLGARVFEEVGDLDWLAQTLVYQGWMLIRIGRFDRALKGLERSKKLFEERQLTPAYGMGSHPSAPLIILSVIQGDYSRAIELGEKLKSESVTRGDKHNQSFACYGLTSAYLNQGDYEAALDNGEQAVSLADELGNEWFGAYCHIELGNVHRVMENYAEAEQHYQNGLQIRQEYKDPEGIAVTAIHLGEISLLQGDNQTAQGLFEKSLSIYQKLNDQGGLATAHHSLGQVAFQAGRASSAAHHFREALVIAGEISFVPLLLSVLIDIGSLMITSNKNRRGTELLQLVHDHPSSNQQQREKVKSLLDRQTNLEEESDLDLNQEVAALREELLKIAEDAAPPEETSLIDPLTKRESDVLVLIAQGLTNPEIAERLFISVGTVKAHTHHIYQKLGVSNRVEAVTKAQESSLLEH